MTRKHYEAIATIINDNLCDVEPAAGFDEGYDAGVREVAHRLESYFAADNPNFDSVRFLTACGIF
jgi:hypothetical protein